MRELTPEARAQLEPIGRAPAVPARPVARAQAWRAVAARHSHTAAARQAGRRSSDAVAMRGARCNREGMAAVCPRPGGGRPARHPVADRERLLAEARRAPDRERDGTAVWSLRTLRRAVRQSGLPQIGPAPIRQVLRGRIDVAETAVVVRDGHGATAPAARRSGGGGDRDRSRGRGEKN